MGPPTAQPDLFSTEPRVTCDTRFRTISMDPPWEENGGGKIKRGADRHYPTVPTKKMPRLILDSGVWNPADDCHLWMWVTNNFLVDGIWLMQQLGFRYVTNVAWIKIKDKIKRPGVDELILEWLKSILKIGLGQYVRGAHELLLFGTRGKAMLPDKAALPKSVIIAPRGQHSRKPDEQYPLIEAVSRPPRIEFFARRPWPGWQCWGNEVNDG